MDDTAQRVKDKDEKGKRKRIVILVGAASLVFGAVAFGLLGAFMGLIGHDWSPLRGLLGGAEIGILVWIGSLVGALVWWWIKEEADKGRLLPYLLCGIGAAIVLSGVLAMNLGKPSCEEQGDAPYSYCVSYANDGFEATSNQKWDKFWRTLPVTVIIASLIAVIVRNEMRKHQK